MVAQGLPHFASFVLAVAFMNTLWCHARGTGKASMLHCTVLSNKFENSAGFTPPITKSQLVRIGHFDINNASYIDFLNILKLLKCALLNNIN